MPEDMNGLFYWVSVTSYLLHTLRDENIDNTADRDPILGTPFHYSFPKYTNLCN